MKLTRMIQLLIVFLFINSSVKSMHFNDVLASRGQISVSPDWNTSTPSYASPDTSGYSDIDISLMRARGEGIYDPNYTPSRVTNEPVQTTSTPSRQQGRSSRSSSSDTADYSESERLVFSSNDSTNQRGSFQSKIRRIYSPERSLPDEKQDSSTYVVII